MKLKSEKRSDFGPFHEKGFKHTYRHVYIVVGIDNRLNNFDLLWNILLTQETCHKTGCNLHSQHPPLLPRK